MERKTVYLLRHDVESVRSVDTLVWAQPAGIPPATEQDWWAGESLWPDLAGLLAATPAVDHAGTVAVRITALEDDDPAREGASPAGPEGDQYDLLGYDVADRDLLSGLSNCGYSAEDAAALAPAWAPRLNEWHLFDDPGDAMAFAEITADRVPEHAPFWGYGIYRLR